MEYEVEKVVKHKVGGPIRLLPALLTEASAHRRAERLREVPVL